MDEQTSPSTEPTPITPDSVVDNSPAVEPPQAEPTLAQDEPIPAPEKSETEPVSEAAQATPEASTPQIEPLSEPLPTSPETSTPHLPVDEALPKTAPEPAPQGTVGIQGSLPFSKTDNRQENLVAPAEAPRAETPTPGKPEEIKANPSEETPPKAEESPRTPPVAPPQPQRTPEPESAPTQQTPQGTPQPEPVQQPPASHPESVPVQAPPPATPPKNILMLLLTKAHLVTQLRKQKKLLKIMGLFLKKKSITNDDVEKLLHVSDATALRYLTQLKKENKITQIGKTGQGVTYTKR